MMKRFALLLAALFVATMVFVAPVFASGNHENNNNGADNDKVCVLRHENKGDDHNDGDKDYRWVSEDNKHHGDKVVKDKFCEHKDNNGEHKNNADNNNDDDNGNANNDDDNGHANNDDDNGNANNSDDDWS